MSIDLTQQMKRIKISGFDQFFGSHWKLYFFYPDPSCNVYQISELEHYLTQTPNCSFYARTRFAKWVLTTSISFYANFKKLLCAYKKILYSVATHIAEKDCTEKIQEKVQSHNINSIAKKLLQILKQYAG